jgi:hypothetical protein
MLRARDMSSRRGGAAQDVRHAVIVSQTRRRHQRCQLCLLRRATTTVANDRGCVKTRRLPKRKNCLH